VSFRLEQRELEVQVWLPSAVLMLVSHPTDYFARTHFLADNLPFNRGCIEMSIEGPEGNTVEQVLGDYHMSIIAVGWVVTEV
jgi:hypothetical protein